MKLHKLSIDVWLVLLVFQLAPIIVFSEGDCQRKHFNTLKSESIR